MTTDNDLTRLTEADQSYGRIDPTLQWRGRWYSEASVERIVAAHVAAARAEERERAERERLEFTARLGFGDGRTEPAASLVDMVDPIEQAFSEAREYHEGPRICEPCGEWLATAICDHCHGSGYGPGTATGAYEECEGCAGVGKVHPGCVEKSYADLAATVERVRALADEWAGDPVGGDLWYSEAVDALRTALDPAPTQPECDHPNHGAADHDCTPFLSTQPEEGWECGPHANAWNGHDARCRQVPAPEQAAGEGEREVCAAGGTCLMRMRAVEDPDFTMPDEWTNAEEGER